MAWLANNIEANPITDINIHFTKKVKKSWGRKFAPICDMVSGAIGTFESNETSIGGHIYLSIGTLVIDNTKERMEGDDIGEVDQVYDYCLTFCSCVYVVL